MNLLFDIGHPAHVHLFKNFIKYLKGNEHNVYVTSRKKDVTEVLLNHYRIDSYSLSAPRTSKIGMLLELRTRNKQIYSLHTKYHFDASFGTSASIGFLNRKYNIPAYNFNEDDDAVVKYYTWLSYPFASKIINPDCIEYSRWKKKRILHPSYHEMAYLHPNNFLPDRSIVESYGLKPKQYIIMRLSGLIAHHDTGEKGISENLYKRIKSIFKGYKIVESHELKKEYQVDPWDMHHILAYSKMIVSDSQTMTIEGAVLGIPSIRINTFIGKSTVIDELEKKYKLAYGFYPNDETNIVQTITNLVNKEDLETEWKQKRNDLLNEKIDLNTWLINYFEDHILNERS